LEAGQVTKRLLWLHGDHRLTIESYSEGTDCEGTCVIDGGALALLACSVRTHPLIQWSAVTGRKTTIRFRDCILDSTAMFSIDDWIVDATTQPGCFYSVERCDKAANVPIADQQSAW
jgi:hypothetical protein